MWRLKYLIPEWVTDIWRFIRHIPGYYRLEIKQYGYDPETYHHIIQQYEEVLMYITGNRMSKPTYFARDIIALMNDHYCDGCEYRQRCEREDNAVEC